MKALGLNQRAGAESYSAKKTFASITEPVDIHPNCPIRRAHTCPFYFFLGMHFKKLRSTFYVFFNFLTVLCLESKKQTRQSSDPPWSNSTWPYIRRETRCRFFHTRPLPPKKKSDTIKIKSPKRIHPLLPHPRCSLRNKTERKNDQSCERSHITFLKIAKKRNINDKDHTRATSLFLTKPKS